MTATVQGKFSTQHVEEPNSFFMMDLPKVAIIKICLAP